MVIFIQSTTMNIVYIRYISGVVFKNIEYTNLSNLNEKLIDMINDIKYDIQVELLFNNNVLNKFGNIDISISSTIENYDCITIIFIKQCELYCLGNDNGSYISKFKNNNYCKLLRLVIKYRKNNSYDIINKSSYEDIIILVAKMNTGTLIYVNDKLKNDKKTIMLELIKNDEINLKYANIKLKNDRNFIRNYC